MVTQYYIRHFRPFINSLMTRLVYFGSVSFGKDFRCDGIPRILVDKKAKVQIGDNVEFRRNVEIRAHNESTLIIENNVRVDRGVRLLSANTAKIHLATGCRIGLYSVLNGGDSITVGKKTLISGFVYLQTSMHGYSQKEISVQEQGYNHAPVVLEEDVWLGTHVVILPGVKIGKGTVIGSNAVVNKSTGTYKVMGGIPAKELKVRK